MSSKVVTSNEVRATARLMPGGLLVRDWLGIISLAVTLVCIGWKFNDKIRDEMASMGTRLSVLETKVDILLARHVAEDDEQMVTGRRGDSK